MNIEIIATCVSIGAALVSIWKAKDASDNAKEINIQLKDISESKKIESRSNILCNFEIIGKTVCFTVKNIGKVDAKDVKIRCKNEDDKGLYCLEMKNLMNKDLILKPGQRIKIDIRPTYLASMSEMLERFVPGTVDLTIRYKDEFDEYNEE